MEDRYRDSLLERQSECEKIFLECSKKYGLKLIPQYKIIVTNKKTGIIRKVFFADFCDTKRRIVFEIDGGYHNNNRQRTKDLRRTRELYKLGYITFRITNQQVLDNLSGSLLETAYIFIGIDIKKKLSRKKHKE